jgi:hypothetical protein
MLVVVSKEDLILIGIIAVLVVFGLFVVFQPRPPAVAEAEVSPQAALPAVVVEVPAPPPVVAETPTPIPVLTPQTTVSAPTIPVVAIDGVIYADEYAHTTSAGGFQICWSNDDETLRIGLVSPGTGYLAIGFDPENRMAGANFILGAVVAGRVIVRDDFGVGPTQHAPDTAGGGTDDILAAAGSEQNGKTYLEFVIPLDSGDPMDKRLVPGETYKILIAFHETSDDFNAWHSRRGTGSLGLDP